MTVVTWLLNAVPDPQRRTHIGADVGVLGELRESVARHGRRLVVLHDCLDEPDDQHATFVRVEPGGNPYFYRWTLAAAYLAQAPDGPFWCVDGTDVEMLHDPYPHMRHGTLYVGSEPSTFAGGAGNWMRGTCPSVREYLDAHPHRTVLNVGIVGGGRADVLTVASMLAAAESSGDRWDMGAFQPLIYDHFPDHVTGPLVHTVFRANDRAAASWWRHK